MKTVNEVLLGMAIGLLLCTTAFYILKNIYHEPAVGFSVEDGKTEYIADMKRRGFTYVGGDETSLCFYYKK